MRMRVPPARRRPPWSASLPRRGAARKTTLLAGDARVRIGVHSVPNTFRLSPGGPEEIDRLGVDSAAKRILHPLRRVQDISDSAEGAFLADTLKDLLVYGGQSTRSSGAQLLLRSN